MDEQHTDGVGSSMSADEVIRMVESSEEEAGGEFNQHEYFKALSALKGAKLAGKDPSEREKVDAKLLDLQDRYGRLGSY